MHGAQVLPSHNVAEALQHSIPALLGLDIKACRVQVAGVQGDPYPRFVLDMVDHVPAQLCKLQLPVQLGLQMPEAQDVQLQAVLSAGQHYGRVRQKTAWTRCC